MNEQTTEIIPYNHEQDELFSAPGLVATAGLLSLMSILAQTEQAMADDTPVPVPNVPQTGQVSAQGNGNNSGNLVITVPTQINFAVDSQGNLIAPSSEAMIIENLSDRDVKVNSIKVDAASGTEIVDGDSRQNTKDTWSMSITSSDSDDPIDPTDTDSTLKVSDYQEEGEVPPVLAWTMGPHSDEGFSELDLEISGKYNQIGNNALGEKFGSMTWHFDDETKNNELHDTISSLSSSVQSKEGLFDDAISAAEIQQSTLTGLETLSEQAVKKVGPQPPTGTSKLWIDTSGGRGIIKYFNGSTWVACRSVWG